MNLSRLSRKLHRIAGVVGDLGAVLTGNPRRVLQRAYNRTLFYLVNRYLTGKAMWRTRRRK